MHLHGICIDCDHMGLAAVLKRPRGPRHMDFLVLGPLAVISGSGEPVPVRQPQHRAILSVLLLYAGRPCSHAKLIDALWGEKPPHEPGRALLSHISRIRRELRTGDRLETLRSAYRMDPGPGELDLHRFRQLTFQAQLMLAHGDPERAAAKLEAALGCWRDPPLADLPSSPEIDADVAQLLEQRRAAETRLIDLMLALGRHQEVVADLHRIVTERPLDDRAWAQLLLALYRSGRKSEALAAYSKAREAMIRILGTEPGREIQRLLVQILADSEDLALTPPSAPAGLRRPRLSREPAATAAGIPHRGLRAGGALVTAERWTPAARSGRS